MLTSPEIACTTLTSLSSAWNTPHSPACAIDPSCFPTSSKLEYSNSISTCRFPVRKHRYSTMDLLPELTGPDKMAAF